LDTLRQDLKFAFRMLYKDRGFAIAAIITLGLCIGANSALFTIVQSVLLRPLPFPESNRLVITSCAAAAARQGYWSRRPPATQESAGSNSSARSPARSAGSSA